VPLSPLHSPPVLAGTCVAPNRLSFLKMGSDWQGLGSRKLVEAYRYSWPDAPMPKRLMNWCTVMVEQVGFTDFQKREGFYSA